MNIIRPEVLIAWQSDPEVKKIAAYIESVTRITQLGVGLADTSNNREAIPQPPTEQANMLFATSKTDYVVFFALAFALVGALIG